MRERTLLSIALLSSLVGLVLLVFITDDLEPSQTDIGKLDGTSLGEQVKILGTVTNVIDVDGTIIMTLSHPSRAKVVAFDMDDPPREGSTLEIIGHMEDYEGEDEVVADRIRRIES